ncbi:MAG: hypothetical protein LWX07_06075 [Bacteroidetes bacterium]|nr:hypothetical protein [Bacteroidota bacterium]
MYRKLPNFYPLHIQDIMPGILAGPHNPIFYRNRGYIQETVKKFNLEKMKLPQTRETAQEFVFSEPWWIYGGPIFPHLHLDGDVYLLNDEQWKTFSEGILKGIKEKIANAGKVNFAQVSALAEAVEML